MPHAHGRLRTTSRRTKCDKHVGAAGKCDVRRLIAVEVGRCEIFGPVQDRATERRHHERLRGARIEIEVPRPSGNDVHESVRIEIADLGVLPWSIDGRKDSDVLRRTANSRNAK